MRLSDVRARGALRYSKRRNRLVERHLFLVIPVARRLRRTLPAWVEFDELLADGALGLLYAAVRFDRSRGVPFARFATRYVRGAMLDALRRRPRTPHSLSGVEVGRIDLRFQQVDDRHDARAMPALVSDARQRLVTVLYFFDELTMKRVGRAIGISESRVSRLVNDAIRVMRRRSA